MHLSVSNVREQNRNTSYPRRVSIETPEELAQATKFDHIAALMQGNKRSSGNFIEADCIILDIDNTHSEDPDNWVTLKDVEEAFPGVPFYAVQSRNYMKVKSKKDNAGNDIYFEAREKWHLYFPLSRTITTSDEYEKLIKDAARLFPFFDEGALDIAHFLYGVKEPQVEYYDGD